MQKYSGYIVSKVFVPAEGVYFFNYTADYLYRHDYTE